MAFDFPNSPTESLQYASPGGPVYIYTSGRWKVLPSDDLTVVGDLTVGGNITGDLFGSVTGNLTGSVTITGYLTPSVTGTIDLGTATQRWATVYTS